MASSSENINGLGADPATYQISYSKVVAYNFCPQKYRLVFVERWFAPSNQYIALGHSIHKTLELFHSRKGMESIDDLLECYNEAWVNDGFTTPQAAQEYFEKGERMLVRYWEDNQDRKTEILFVEKHFAFDLNGVKLRGIIDRIDRHPDGTVEVIDYKTHNEVWEQDKADADLQLSVYHMAAQDLLGAPPDTLTYYFLAHGRRVSTHRTPEQIEEALKVIAKAREQILSKNFVPNTAMCHRCDFREKCPHSIAKSPEPVEKPGTFSIKDLLER